MTENTLDAHQRTFSDAAIAAVAELRSFQSAIPHLTLTREEYGARWRAIDAATEIGGSHWREGIVPEWAGPISGTDEATIKHEIINAARLEGWVRQIKRDADEAALEKKARDVIAKD